MSRKTLIAVALLALALGARDLPAQILPAKPTAPAAKPAVAPTRGVATKPTALTQDGRAKKRTVYALVSTLRLNNAQGTVEVNPGNPASVSWNLAGVPNASGIHLIVSTTPLDTLNCAAPPAGLAPDSGKYTASPRALTLTSYTLGSTYYLKGCVFQRTPDPFGGFVDTYTGDITNAVTMNYSAPNLTVKSIVYTGNELRFTVANLGPGTKKPSGTTVKYTLRVEAARGGRVPGGGQPPREGLAPFTTLAVLPPNDPARNPEERVLNYSLANLPSGSQITICINRDLSGQNQIAETNYADNCLTRRLGQLRPDVVVSYARIEIKCCYKHHSTGLGELFGFHGTVIKHPDDDRVVAVIQNRGAPGIPEAATLTPGTPGSLPTTKVVLVVNGQERASTTVPTPAFGSATPVTILTDLSFCRGNRPCDAIVYAERPDNFIRANITYSSNRPNSLRVTRVPGNPKKAVALSWRDNSYDEVGFRVVARIRQGINATQVKSDLPANTTSFTWTVSGAWKTGDCFRVYAAGFEKHYFSDPSENVCLQD